MENPLTRADLLHVYNALQAFEAELDQLEASGDWFTSDSRDRLDSSKQLLASALGIEEDYEGELEAHELVQRTLTLRFE